MQTTIMSKFINNAIKENNIDEINRLCLLFSFFVDNKYLTNIYNFIKNHSDADIINFINNKCKLIKYRNTKTTGDKWDITINYLVKKLNNIVTIKNIDYIDVCCGSCKKTGLFQKYLGINNNNISCTDINSWGPYTQNKQKKYNFKLIENDTLQFENNIFDLCTCILSLHHIENVDNFILEIKRIIKPGGIFILIEHSNENEYDKLFIDIQHYLYISFFEKKQININDMDYIKCLSKEQWNDKITNLGFTIIDYGWVPSEYKKFDNTFYTFYKNNL